MDYDHLPVDKLKKLCKERNIDVDKGKRQDLVQSLLEYDAGITHSKGKHAEKKKKKNRRNDSDEEFEDPSSGKQKQRPEPEPNRAHSRRGETHGPERPVTAVQRPTSSHHPPMALLTELKPVAPLKAGSDGGNSSDGDEEAWRSPDKTKQGKSLTEADIKNRKKDKPRAESPKRRLNVSLNELQDDSYQSEAFRIEKEREEALHPATIEKQLVEVVNGEKKQYSKEKAYSCMPLKRLKEVATSKGLDNAESMSKQDLVTWLMKQDDVPQPKEHHELNPGSGYHGLSVPELKAECKKRGLIGYRKIGRHEIVVLLELDDANKSKSVENEEEQANKAKAAGQEKTHLIQQCRELGHDVTLRNYTIHELQARINVDEDLWQELDAVYSGNEFWNQVMKKSKSFPMENGTILLLGSKKDPNEILVTDATKIQQRVDFLRSCYGQIEVKGTFDVGRVKLVKKLVQACMIANDWSDQIDEKSCNRKECEDATHAEWFKLRGKGNGSFEKLKQLVDFVIVSVMWN